MDKGARFFRCDFQVHSPRDCNWKGCRPNTAEGRAAYARKFIAACRSKKLDAVAITDHHDVCFFPFIRAAAEAEADDAGVPVPAHRRIVVFPGMELTLAVPCQALLIFDADFPADLLLNLYPLLGVMQNGDEHATHLQAARLDKIATFDALHDLLDRNDYFRGRYILFPNVTDGGSSSLMRIGFAPHYKSMPCVGGYLDGPVSKIGEGTRRILDGRVEAYGFRKLGLFPTSDNRSEDFEELGAHSAWVKWSTPKAEALRQACLACETRISHAPPQVPTMVVTRLEVSDSKFLGPVDVYFNSQYTCLIGGRGTGKSTLLEYLRWGLCDQPPTTSGEDELAPYQGKRASLIERTLAPVGGVVTVSFMLDSIPHAVRRSPETKEVSLKIGDGDFQVCTEADVRDLLPLQAYSQKQLSAVGIRTDELVRFIRTSIKHDLDRVGGEIEAQKAHAKEVFASLLLKRRLERELARDQLELSSLSPRVESLRRQLEGVGEDERRVLAEHDQFLREEQAVEGLGRDLETVREMAADFRASLDRLPSQAAAPETPNAALVGQMQDGLAACLRAAASQLDSVVAALASESPALRAYSDALAAWRAAFAAHEEAYGRAKQAASVHDQTLRQIDAAEARIKELRTAVARHQDAIKQFGPLDQQFWEARAVWVEHHKTRADMMQAKCEELTALSEERIRAKIARGGGVQKVKDRLLSLLVGTKIRTKKVEELCDSIAKAADPLEEWGAVLRELESLVDYSGGATDEPKSLAAPLLMKNGFAAGELERLAKKLTPEEWLELSLTELDDVPEFEYRQSSGHYIQFADASAGQQATALLRVLLNQPGPPLVIDQPEEDLDNQVILEIIADIWKAKTHRQIIFSSHNANIVVNGDADLVICFDYRTAGDHSGGLIKCAGAIDVDEIKTEITVVMEGGKDAFRLRKEKYGF